jgi:hypothetical protein
MDEKSAPDLQTITSFHSSDLYNVHCFQYTLRLCGEHGLKSESVLLHGILGQLDEATELALQV